MRATLVALSLTLTLCGCSNSGNDDKPSKSEPSAVKAPLCESAWQEGNTLPADYQGCKVKADATAKQGNPVECADGKTLASWNEYWAFAGQTVKVFDAKYADDPDGDPPFKAAMADCLG